MSKAKIQFQYSQEEVIKCQKDELMRDIISRYGTKSGLKVNELNFLYGNNKINPDQTLSQVNDKDSKITIVVESNKNEKNKDKDNESNIIKCPDCLEPAVVEFTKDYGISLTDATHGTKKIKLQEYNNTQIIDESEIKCSNCPNSLANSDVNNFYYCFECKKNFCSKCKPSHSNHKNIVDFSEKDFRCPQHPGKDFASYCLNCKKNLCVFCSKEHKNHDITNFSNLIQEENKEYIDRIQKVNKIVDAMISYLQKFKEYLDVYSQINAKLNENLRNMNLNYQNLKSMKNLVDASFLREDISRILENKDTNKRFKKIMSMYDKMSRMSIDDNNSDKNLDNEDVDEIPEVQSESGQENINEIMLKVKVEQSDVDNVIYFLDNTDNLYFEKGNHVYHEHDNLKEMNESNTTLIIDGKKVPFSKSFIPSRSGTFSIKLVIKGKLSNCSYMFSGCENIIATDFSKFNTQDVTNMSYMFNNCSSLTELNLSSFNTKKVTNMNNMFCDCKLLKSLDLSSFNTENVSGMYYMLSNCESLKSLDLLTFNTQNVTDLTGMFDGCSSLEEINLTGFKTEKVTSMNRMFSGCKSLKTLDLTSFNPKNVTDMAAMLEDCSSLTTLTLKSFNTEKATNMACMFNRCSALANIDLSSFKTEKVTSMNRMFSGCKSLKTLDLTSFNPKNVTDMAAMLEDCSSLTTLTLKSFNTEKATNMACMFNRCSALANIDLSSFKTKNVTSMQQMFGGCAVLKKLNLSSFNTEKVTNMEKMFEGCSILEDLNINSFKFRKNVLTNGIFKDCLKLKDSIIKKVPNLKK